MATEFWQAFYRGKPAEFSTGATGNERETCPIRDSRELALDDAAVSAGYKSYKAMRFLSGGYEVRKITAKPLDHA